MKAFLQSDTPLTDHRLLEIFDSIQVIYLNAFGKSELTLKIADLQSQSSTLHFITKGYNLHDLFVEVMKLSGPAVVKIVSYSMTDFPMRIISTFLEKKIITDLRLVLDFTVKRTPALAQFVSIFAVNLRYTDVHSKIILIQNDRWDIVIISSANFTRNNRYENGIIFTGKQFTDTYSQWFQLIYDAAKP